MIIHQSLRNRLLRPLSQLTHQRFTISSFEVWQGNPPTFIPSDPKTSNQPSVLLLGYAGSPKPQLKRYADLYSSLGHPCLYCILPLEHFFHYDISRVVECGHIVLSEVYKQGMAGDDGLVMHSFSNNGAVFYQQIVGLISDQYQDVVIRGAVFDSAPGPGTIVPEVLAMYLHLHSLVQDKDFVMAKHFLPMAYPLVNLANNLSWKEVVNKSRAQIQSLMVNWPKNKDVPWVGSYLKTEQADWPLLFLYSKTDNQIPWAHIESVMRHQRKTGRKVFSNCFPSSGHVAHMKKYPEEYRQEVSSFLEQLAK